MEAVISNFRSGRHNQVTNQMILLIDGIDKKEKTKDLMGKKVTWKSPKGKELRGEIIRAHGNKGAVRARFETGMPGQSIGTKVIIK
ncbi:MAG: 50S ribosomal protein L35Ae [archaeon GW2011_AR20]|nr:MAG: 50S ribosomal protein L35Ae [archaeon GW2011_AR20]MBS3160825.1 50S ribosomal protein L35ae [Candidatus Woesearchaeota archaeon]